MLNNLPTIEEWLNNNPLSLSIFNNKYRYSNESLGEFLERVSNGNDLIAKLILEKKFLFGGRVLANRGLKDKKITLSNCYVIAPPEDNKKDIFRCASEIADTFSYGGGCGIDLSKLRPRGATVHNAAAESTGPVSFMSIYSDVTSTIAQNGRRGALMISMDVNHPDIEEFIDCKTVAGKVEAANISVRVNDSFMKAVEEDKDYFLHWPCDGEYPVAAIEYNKLTKVGDYYIKKVKAKELFNKLAKNNWDWAEPGILFWDSIKHYNMLNTNPNFEFGGTNPCAEEPLPNYGSCNLGSANLSAYVKDAFLPTAHFDMDSFIKDVRIMVGALNDVLLEGIPLHPLKKQSEVVNQWRQIGLGIMGLGETLIKLGIPYDSKEALMFASSVTHNMAVTAVEQSVTLASVYGSYPASIGHFEDIANSAFIKSLKLDSELLSAIRKVGMFNSQLLTCAPTGSTATMFQTSTGIEPYFEFTYSRTTKSLEGGDKVFTVNEKVVDDFEKVTGTSFKDCKAFVNSQNIDSTMRVKMQATIQRNIDASISSTVNLPNSATIEEVENLYKLAHKAGLKGMTVFRNGCARSPILATTDSSKETPKEENTVVKMNSITPIKRKKLGKFLHGLSSQWKCACGTLHITINSDADGNLVELFTNASKNGTCKANLNGLTRLASTCLRGGIKVEEVIDQLSGVQCPACTSCRARGIKVDGVSCPDIMAKALKQTKEFLDSQKTEVKPEKVEASSDYEECPECHEKTLIRTGGCKQCTSCGYSKCDL